MLSSLADLPLGRKLVLAFLSVAALVAVTGLVGYVSVGSALSVLRETGTVQLPQLEAVLAIDAASQAVLAGEAGLVNRRMMEATIRQAQYRAIDDGLRAIEAGIAAYEATPRSAEEDRGWAEFKRGYGEWRAVQGRVRSGSEEKDRMIASGVGKDDPPMQAQDQKVFTAHLEGRRLIAANGERLHALVESARKKVEGALGSASREAAAARAVIGLFAVLAVAGAAVLGWRIARSVSEPLGRAVAMLKALSEGRLGQRLRLARRDEIGTLAATMDGFADVLQNEYVAVLNRVAAGDVSMDVASRSADDEIGPALRHTIESLRGLVGEMDALTRAAVAGELSTRGRAEAFGGAYGDVVRGVNATLDALVRPLNVAAEHVERIARGEIPQPITEDYRGDFREIRDNLNTCMAAIRGLLDDTCTLTAAAAAGDFTSRADASRHAGDFRRIVEGTNAALDTVAEQAFWYESILDAIPLPISVTDEEMRWTFVNRPVEQLLGVKRGDVVGRPCHQWNAGICRSEECGVTKLRRGEPRTAFEQAGAHYQVDTSFLTDTHGRRIGHIEVVQDVTARQRASEYLEREVARLSSNLELLARGDFALDLRTGAADRHTEHLHAQISRIDGSLARLGKTVSALVGDLHELTEATIHGRLDARAPRGTHTGEFRRIVDGVNGILDALVGNLEAIPTPVQYIDTEYRIQYVNASGAKLLGRTKEQLVGANCAEAWRTAKCGTDECPCGVSMRGGTTHQCSNHADLGGGRRELACASAPLLDAAGRTVGAFEFVSDQTEVVSAERRATRIVDYQQRGAAALGEALARLAAGDLSATVDLEPADADTAATRDALLRIRDGALAFKESVIALSADIQKLADAAVAGQLSVRADASRHRGDFVGLVQGINGTHWF